VRQKLVTLAVGALLASVLALPATAGPGPGKGPKHAVPAACKQAAADAAKTHRQSLRPAVKAFHDQQKAARAAFRAANPSPTHDQIRAFRAQQHADAKVFAKQQREANKAWRQGQLASVKACAATA
jgi:hypothetical protein